MKLYDMTKDYLELLDAELEPEQLADCLDSIEEAIEDKGANIVAVLNSLESDTTALDKEIKRLQARKKAIVNNSERLKEYLRYNMELTGITKIKHPLFSITLGKPTVTAEIVDVDFLPEEYVTTEVKFNPDKKAILAALKDGKDIPGAILSTGKSRLLIK